MVVKISSTPNGTMKEVDLNHLFIASEEPLYIGIIIKPEPGIWEELMDSEFAYIHTNEDVKETKIGYRIEVGENSIFFVTLNSESAGNLIREIKR
ncbi:hypothetical protein ACNF42_00690 [Cuniculiplasma sp. SKW3]|uniref:hypothetical protein n=1 Tax=Cuniculiplasma sp. SKW3 TaxID=3400170 RepID=UPI003FD63AE8